MKSEGKGEKGESLNLFFLNFRFDVYHQFRNDKTFTKKQIFVWEERKKKQFSLTLASTMLRLQKGTQRRKNAKFCQSNSEEQTKRKQSWESLIDFTVP